MAEVTPGEHWACYYRRTTGDRCGPATLRVIRAGSEGDAAMFLYMGGTARERRVYAAKVIRDRYRVGIA